MPVACVSDENNAAISDASVEFSDLEFRDPPISVRPSMSGRIDADLLPGGNQFVLAARGCPAERTAAAIADALVQFRVPSARPYGFAWPRYAFASDRAGPCMSSPDPYHISLWRYGQGRGLTTDLGFPQHEVGATSPLSVHPVVSALTTNVLGRSLS
jgi:hypothetical protein